MGKIGGVMRIEIKMEQRDIDGAERCNPRLCPIVLALRRYILIQDISVLPGSLRIGGYHTSLPYELSEFMIKFDKDRNTVKPLTFQVTVPFDLIK